MTCPRHPTYVGAPIEHTHRWPMEPDRGEGHFKHTHAMPCCEYHPMAARGHAHDGRGHSHPHPDQEA